MKFGKKLMVQQDIPLFRNQFVSYTNLKKLVKEIHAAETRSFSSTEVLASELWWFDSTQKTSLGNIVPERIAFVKAVEDEIDKTQHHYSSSIKTIRHLISDIYARINSKFRLDNILSDIDSISSEILLLDRYIWHAKQLILKITKKHDRVTNYQVNSWILIRMERTEFWNARLDELLIGISDAYTAARQLEKNADDLFVQSRQLGDAENFVRKNEKYFVKPEDIMLVKLLIAKHVPLDIFGRKKSKGPMKLENLAGLQDASVINSIYLDDTSRTMYHERTGVEGKKGNIIRIRWYGSFANPCAECWMERKTRRTPVEGEEYAVDEAVKERFRLNRRNIKNYMNGEWSMDKKAKSMVAKKQIREKDVVPMLATANNIQAEIVEKKLHSSLRTVVRRSAFQEGADQSLRFSLDHNLHIIDEVIDASDGEWARDLDMPLKLSSVKTLPYAVLEVKTQKNAPEWVAQLKQSGYLIPSAHFSKFLYGTCKLAPAEVRYYPAWWNNVVQLEATIPPSPPLITCAFMTKTPASVKFRSGLVERMELNSDLKGTAELMREEVDAQHNPVSKTEQLKKVPSRREQMMVQAKKVVDEGEVKNLVKRQSQFEIKTKRKELSPPPIPAKDADTFPEKNFDGATVIEMQMLEKKNEKKNEKNMQQRNMQKKSSVLNIFDKKKDKITNKQKTMEQRAAKTYFANERTMLSWLNASTFLALAGITLMGNQTETGRNSGIALIGITIIFAIYALYKYMRRLFGLKDSKKTGLADKWGPPALIVCFVGVLIFLAVYYGRKATEFITQAEAAQVTL